MLPDMLKFARIPESVSLALHSMAILAGRPDELITTREIAALLGASSAHLAKVLKNLEHTGYVRSVRGPAGGFQLIGDPDEISLMDIYQAMEGPLETEGCLLTTPLCGGDSCILGEMIRSLEAQFREHLSNTRLSQFTLTVGVESA